MSTSDKDASDQNVTEQTEELKAKYPIFTAVLEKFHNGSKISRALLINLQIVLKIHFLSPNNLSSLQLS
jgi:hypothetical protein